MIGSCWLYPDHKYQYSKYLSNLRKDLSKKNLFQFGHWLNDIPPPPPIIACWFSLLDVKNNFSAQITEPRSIDGDDDDDGDGNDGLLEYNNETNKTYYMTLSL